MAMQVIPSLHIGISNVVLPGNKTTFPEEYRQTSRLRYYASLFDTVEINSCFYKIPRQITYEKWSNDVPAHFNFTLKLCKQVTHEKDLAGELNYIDQFMQAAEGVGEKKGCLLVQFPGKISLDHFEKVETIVHHIRSLDVNHAWKIAVEFRNTTWYIRETWDMLDEFSATMVLHDKAKARMEEMHGHADFVYLRLHGPAGDYRGSYSNAFLENKKEEALSWLSQDKEVFIYFNNTAGNAFENAVTLQKMMEIPR